MNISKLVGLLLAGVMAVTGVPAVTEPLTVSASAEELLPAPKNIKITAVEETWFCISWSAVKGAQGYIVYLYDNNSGKYKRYKNSGTTDCAVTDLKRGETYRFKVAAYTGNTLKPTIHTMSKEYSVTTKLAEASSGKLLPAPEITYTSTSRKEITLKWSKVEGADKYGVFIYNDKTGTYQVYDFYKKSAAGSKITIKDLTPGVQYKIRVAALVKTTDDYEIQTLTKDIILTTNLSAPKNVVGYENGSGELTLAWLPVDRAVAYRVWYFSEKKGEYTKLKDVKTTSCKIKGLKTYNKYLFKVSAIKKGSENAADVDNYSEVYSFIVGGGKKITLPTFPKLGANADTAVKAMDIDSNDVYSYSSETMALKDLGDGGFIMLTFDENGKLAEGIYRVFYGCCNFEDALKKLNSKNGTPKTYTSGNENMIVWKKTGCIEYIDYSGGMFEYRIFDPEKIPDHLKDYYSELGL